MSEFEHILNFAVIGTVLTTSLIASGSWLMGHYGLHHIKSVRANVAFACLISSVDPVATMAAYCKLKIPEKQPLLYTMVFGEAAINDAVAITLFTVVNSNSSASIGEEIVICLFGSLLCGAALACLLVALMGYCRMHGRARLLTLAILGIAWLIFAMAESMALSGIIANLFAGIVFRRFGGCLFTEHDEHGVTELLEFCGGLAESLVFMMVGFIASLLTSLDGLFFGLWATLICLAARGVVVPVCAAASNAGKRAAAYMEDRVPVNILTWRHQVMMWNGGLRGGVSLVLALSLNKDWCVPVEKDTIVEGTYVVIVLLLVVCGGTTKRLLSCVGMAEAAQPEEYVAELGDGGSEGSSSADERPGSRGSLGEQPRERLISTQSMRSEKELRERRPLITTARARWWGTAIVELFEPYVLGDRRVVEELVQAGARLENPEPCTPRG
jgi:NhaP-type Na+/H+ or K+/H+ antiporter